jgi:hypothetical protein
MPSAPRHTDANKLEGMCTEKHHVRIEIMYATQLSEACQIRSLTQWATGVDWDWIGLGRGTGMMRCQPFFILFLQPVAAARGHEKRKYSLVAKKIG